MFSRAALYFEEVVRRGSIRRASESLNIAASAIDRQILLLEESFGVPLFERLPQGVRLTTAGELVADGIRRWQREYQRIKATIDDLRGLRRGGVTIALEEGAAEFLSNTLRQFQKIHPSIVFHLKMAGSRDVVELVLKGEAELGLTFNPPKIEALRLERTAIYRLGALVRPDHPFAGRTEIKLQDCADHPIIAPDENLSLRAIFNDAWAKCVGGRPTLMSVADSINVMKSLARCGMGIALLTEIDAYREIKSGELTFLPLSNDKIPLSALSLVSANKRLLSVSASLILQQLAAAMSAESVPGI